MNKWDKAYKEGIRFLQNVNRDIVSELGLIGRELSIVDLGCGAGELCRDIYKAKIAQRIIGVDNSEVALAIAIQDSVVADGGIEYIKADLENEAFCLSHQANFDAITCKLVFTFIGDKPMFIQNCFRLLKPEGKLLIYTLFEGDHPSKPGIETKRADFNIATAGYVSKEERLDSGGSLLSITR